MKKIPRDAEASNVLVGEVDFLNKPFVAFVRLAQATTLGGLTEVPVPTRYDHLQDAPSPWAPADTFISRTFLSRFSASQIPIYSPGTPRKGQVI